ncbi:hypothetical protein AB0H43_08520 [Hamadaea sp. NPDC050747]|uniref:hypothetical protein n=1 Tax=Hamadaea sp. NPDC050747 TaxID=3155789 RepID=UPI0033FBAAC5
MSHRRQPRPLLLPGVRPLWRDRRRVQLGLDQRRAVVLELAHPSAGRLLDLLDGSRTERMLLDQAAALGMSEEATRTLLRDLMDRGLVIAADALLPAGLPATDRERLSAEAGALALEQPPRTPAEVLRRRARSRVVIGGGGRLAETVADGLREAGVRRVAQAAEPQALLPDRVGGPRVRAGGAALRVEISGGRLPAARSLPLLLVTVREAAVTVGPMVVAAHGPCLRCLGLHRVDRDPRWQHLESQLPASLETEPPCSAVTVLAAAARTIAEALTLLDGGPSALIGASVEISGADEIRRRRWERHPACACPP